MFYGNGSSLRGLLFHIGNNIDKNSLGAEKCLDLISKFLCFDYNPDCETYVSCLKMSNFEHIKSLNLNKHLESNKIKVTNDCFNIILILLSIDKNISILKTILNERGLDRYENWLKLRETV